MRIAGGTWTDLRCAVATQSALFSRANARENSTFYLQSAQPTDDVRAIDDEPAASRRRECVGKHLRERRAL